MSLEEKIFMARVAE
jgi:14-3-3 protein epsilon